MISQRSQVWWRTTALGKQEVIYDIFHGPKCKFRFNIPLTTNKPVWDINVYDEEDEKGAKYRVKIQ